jgi:hypothetical protein
VAHNIAPLTACTCDAVLQKIVKPAALCVNHFLLDSKEDQNQLNQLFDITLHYSFLIDIENHFSLCVCNGQKGVLPRPFVFTNLLLVSHICFRLFFSVRASPASAPHREWS